MCILTIFARNPLACPSPRTLMYVGLIYYEPIYIKRRPKPATARGARDMDAKTLCLGVLSRGAASGYEIKKAFEEGPFSHFHQASFGSIYPALNALSADGLVAVRAQAQQKRPAKKIYSLTPKGRDRKSTRLNSSP